MRFTSTRLSMLISSITLLLPVHLSATTLDNVVTTQQQMDTAAQQSQAQIDSLDEQTRELLAEYRQVLQQAQTLKSYNDQLESVVRSQSEERTSIEQQLENIETTQRDIVPLMLRMIEVIEQFVALDVPFLPAERNQRIAQLQSLMERSDVTLSEKYRRIMEAYQVETEYGRTIEAYQGELQIDGTTRTVDFIRVGRVNLYYLTLDERESGVWDIDKQDWHQLPSSHNKPIVEALKIARKQLPPDLMVLPVKTVGAQ